MVGWRRTFPVAGVHFRADCSGFVEAVYDAEGIPLRDAVRIAPQDRGSLVAGLYRMVAELGTLFKSELEPLPGDLIFWNNTYDRNRNGKLDDPLTHVGVVEQVLADGTIVFLHRGAHGVARGRMNLTAPSSARTAQGGELNAPLRVKRGRDPKGTRYLASELFEGFGRFDPPRLAGALGGSGRLHLDALGLGERAPSERWGT